MLEATNLNKIFKIREKRGKEVKTLEAVKDVNLKVKDGEIYGFLGPNGAGKTTTMRMLTTLLDPTSGEAVIAGYRLLDQKEDIRRNIGYVSQAGGSDPHLTGFEVLSLQARLFGFDRKSAETRSLDLIKRFEMESFADRVSSSYSGGQRRRLDVALGMIHKPKLLFLDEPTLGLDPQSRARLWDEIRKLREDGMTIFFTTHYLDEADKLCDRLAIIDNGIIVAEGTPGELKSSIAADSIIIGLKDDSLKPKAIGVVKKLSTVTELVDHGQMLHAHVKNGEAALPDLIRQLDAAAIGIDSIQLTHPSLDDVFLLRTGRSLRETSE